MFVQKKPNTGVQIFGVMYFMWHVKSHLSSSNIKQCLKNTSVPLSNNKSSYFVCLFVFEQDLSSIASWLWEQAGTNYWNDNSCDPCWVMKCHRMYQYVTYVYLAQTQTPCTVETKKILCAVISLTKWHLPSHAKTKAVTTYSTRMLSFTTYSINQRF